MLRNVTITVGGTNMRKKYNGTVSLQEECHYQTVKQEHEKQIVTN
jgi:hypothetical protein